MKICTITCHKVYNYGACLQAYALQKYLQLQGHEVQIIDYVPDGTNSQFDFWYVSPNSKYYKLCKRFKVVNWFFAVLNSFRVNNSKKRNTAFESFQSHFYNLTSRYRAIEELRENPPSADIYIAGSDQIWNPLVSNGRNYAFYLDFGDSSVKKVSYAASFSVLSMAVSDEQIKFVKPLLNSFDKISIRESSGLEILSRIGVEGSQVLDPVFLLSQEQWHSIIPNKRLICKKYILVYHLFAESEGLVEFVKKEAASKGLEIVAINDRCHRSYADIQINGAGPIEFVSLIENAEIVVADSFHATAFSLIFNKDFHIFYSFANVSRMADLLEAVGIEDRLNSFEYSVIRWDSVNAKIGNLRESSMEYLNF